MRITNSHLQQLYKGYLNTPLLWNSNSVLGLQQLHMHHNVIFQFNREIHKQLRLGFLVEQFVFNQLESFEDCNILAENLQIQKHRETLGEIDALIEIEKTFVHLEIVYKFYLYDESLGSSEIERWIGPNRNDSLLEKITKLKNKQLPLLYGSECASKLEAFQLKAEDFRQKVLFKAQLFKPYQVSAEFQELNQDCLCGFYINRNQLDDFRDCEFYLPSKLDWMLNVEHSVDWMPLKTFKLKAYQFLKQQKSPLFWIKRPNLTLEKCFLVWW